MSFAKKVFSYAAAIMVSTFVIYYVYKTTSITEVVKPIPQQTDNWETVSKLEKQEKLYRASTLLELYFGGEQIIRSFENGPAGSMIIKADIDGESREFIMLPDKDHLIEGVMYSPYLTAKNTTPAHSKKAQLIAQENQAMIDNVESLKGQFKAKVNATLPPDATVEVKAETNPPLVKHTPLVLPEKNTVESKNNLIQFYKNTESLNYIEVGDPKSPVVYVYFDYNCPGCRQAKKILSKYIDSGDIRVRYVPVGVITKESAIKAAYSLIPASNDDRVTLFDYFNQNKSADELIKKKAPKDEVLRAMDFVSEANKNFFMTPKRLTPTFVFKQKGEVYISNITSERQIKSLINMLSK